jgi:hypothetical protein
MISRYNIRMMTSKAILFVQNCLFCLINLRQKNEAVQRVHLRLHYTILIHTENTNYNYNIFGIFYRMNYLVFFI